MYDIFISHSSKDKKEIVYELVQQLKQRNLDVWLDENEILAGEAILNSIKNGISTALCTILIITPAFFDSIWTSVEIGIASEKNNGYIIPVLCNVTEADIAKKFPIILTLKYLKLETNNIGSCAEELYNNINMIKDRRLANYTELAFKKAVRNFNSCDSPTTNTVSILLSEYEQTVQINVHAAVLYASQISNTIINDLYERLSRNGQISTNTIIDKLNEIKKSSIGLNENIYEHLILLSTPALDSNISVLTNDNDRKKLVELSITAVLEWYSKYLLHNNMIPQDNLEIAWPDELTYNDFITMYEIDQLVLREDLIAPPQITYAWYQYNIYTHIAIRSTVTKKIIGYFAVLPVTDQLYSEIQSGEFKDNDLKVDNLRKYDIPDFYKLYIACVCIHPNYQNTTAFNKLYNALLKMMMELAIGREIYITDIITEASTLQGEKLCKILGLKNLLNTQIGTKIYGATLLPPSWKLKSLSGNKLIKYYKEKYEELKDLF